MSSGPYVVSILHGDKARLLCLPFTRSQTYPRMPLGSFGMQVQTSYTSIVLDFATLVTGKQFHSLGSEGKELEISHHAQGQSWDTLAPML
jgi:hypothetical protein